MLEAIIKTLCYSHVFSFPLNGVEIHERLIQKGASLKQVEKALKNQTKIKSKNGYYYLASSKIVEERVSKELYSQKKIKEVIRLKFLFKAIKSIEAVFVTGAVAVKNAHKDDDIDLLIVTKPGKLWTTRFLLNLCLDVVGKRRRPFSKKINNKLCLNLWLTTDSLEVKKTHQNLYSAYEVIQAKPVFDRSKIYSAFLYENRWIRKYLKNIQLPSKKVRNKEKSKEGNLEAFLYNIQKIYMKPKITREKISSFSAFFHPRDTSQMVMKQYQQLIKKYL